MKKFLKIGLVVILAALVMSACTKTVSDGDNGQTITIKKGETLVVKLNGNATTGYAWALVANQDAILEQQGDVAYHSSFPVLVGSGGVYQFTFKAETTGTTTLNFNYARTWETDKPPFETYSITVEVK